MNALPIVIAALALAVSVLTAWLTFFRAGRLRMTQPTVVFFGPDGGPVQQGRTRRLKVYMRTLLFSTARRGHTIESLYVNLHRGESKQNFSIWVYGNDRLSRGSGMYVPLEGIACNHHFLLPADGTDFRLLAGDYVLRVFAKKVSGPHAEQLAAINLRVSEAQAHELQEKDAGIYFDWGPDQHAYHAHIERKPPDFSDALMRLTGDDRAVGPQ